MALTITRRFGRVVVAESVHPEYRQVLSTFLAHLEPKLVTVPATGGPVAAESIAAGDRPTRRPPWSCSTPTSSASSRTCEAIVDGGPRQGAPWRS